MKSQQKNEYLLDKFFHHLLNGNDLCGYIAEIVSCYLIIIITAVKIIKNPKLKAENRPTY